MTVPDPPRGPAGSTHAFERVQEWARRWGEAGTLVLLLDYDGTLTPIVSEPADAALSSGTRAALDRLRRCPGVELALVSGRSLADVRQRAGLEGIVYAGNHGLEIEGPDLTRTEPVAAASRPVLAEAARDLERALASTPGVFVEDKGLTLSVHFRRSDRATVPRTRGIVQEIVGRRPDLRVTEGNEVLEVRPRVDWDKGRAVEFLLSRLDPPSGTPVLYVGDDVTDEDAFRAVRAWRGGAGDGVLVRRDSARPTAAGSYLRDPAEVAVLLDRLAAAAPDTRH